MHKISANYFNRSVYANSAKYNHSINFYRKQSKDITKNLYSGAKTLNNM